MVTVVGMSHEIVEMEDKEEEDKEERQ